MVHCANIKTETAYRACLEEERHCSGALFNRYVGKWRQARAHSSSRAPSKHSGIGNTFSSSNARTNSYAVHTGTRSHLTFRSVLKRLTIAQVTRVLKERMHNDLGGSNPTVHPRLWLAEPSDRETTRASRLAMSMGRARVVCIVARDSTAPYVARHDRSHFFLKYVLSFPVLFERMERGAGPLFVQKTPNANKKRQKYCSVFINNEPYYTNIT